MTHHRASCCTVVGDAWRHGGPSPAVETIFGLASQQDMKKRLESRLNREYSLEDARELLRKWRREFSKVVSFFVKGSTIIT